MTDKSMTAGEAKRLNEEAARGGYQSQTPVVEHKVVAKKN